MCCFLYVFLPACVFMHVCALCCTYELFMNCCFLHSWHGVCAVKGTGVRVYVHSWKGQLCTFELEGVCLGSISVALHEVWSSLSKDGPLDGFVCLCDEPVACRVHVQNSGPMDPVGSEKPQGVIQVQIGQLALL